MKLAATSKGLKWSDDLFEKDDSGGGYTGDIANCEVVNIISICADEPPIDFPINIDSIRESIAASYKQTYGDECLFEVRTIAYTFRMGYIEIRM